MLFTGEPQRFGLPYLGDPHWDPLWSIAQDAGLPIHFHIGSGDDDVVIQPRARRATAPRRPTRTRRCDLFLKNGVQCVDLITSGVLPRFPDLKFVSVESGIGWVPFVLEAADHSYLEGRPGRVSEWELLPSEYFARQVYATYWFEAVAPTSCSATSPSTTSCSRPTSPTPRASTATCTRRSRPVSGATEEQRHRILWRNAADLYGVESPAVGR